MRRGGALFGLALAAGILGAAPDVHAAKGDPASWTRPVKPFRIVGDIYYVGTEGLAAYLIGRGNEAVLIDGTLDVNAPLIERNIEALGFRLSDIRLLLEDHAHDDHVGAIAQIQRDTHAPFWSSAGDRWALEHGHARGDTDYAPRPFPPIRVAKVVADGETVRRGPVRLTALLTPGHTPGCTSWQTTVVEHGRPLRVLFLCSITVAGNVLAGNRAYPQIAEDFERTFEKLGEVKADVVLTSHPEIADVLGREARAVAGQPAAFVDPAELGRIVKEAHGDFESELAKARARRPPP